ncbi:hypothetical protein O181_050015 [Austropuccinia psidii MF-1]|uniref:Uncharacterized protein n=1 Tax=Austropuccinia psidii MF-1 TaxID=1389203 RepID=A0A9Q3DUK7_9BASI|nr:hypothetical protein [Austropuccinia psidii MF-1]
MVRSALVKRSLSPELGGSLSELDLVAFGDCQSPGAERGQKLAQMGPLVVWVPPGLGGRWLASLDLGQKGSKWPQKPHNKRGGPKVPEAPGSPDGPRGPKQRNWPGGC